MRWVPSVVSDSNLIMPLRMLKTPLSCCPSSNSTVALGKQILSIGFSTSVKAGSGNPENIIRWRILQRWQLARPCQVMSVQWLRSGVFPMLPSLAYHSLPVAGFRQILVFGVGYTRPL